MRGGAKRSPEGRRMKRSEVNGGDDSRSGAKGLALGMVLGLSALVAIAAPAVAEPPNYVGDEVCSACHENEISLYSETLHAKVLNETNARTEAMRRGCESCHGPGQAHVAAGGGRGEGGEGWLSFRDDSGESTADRNAACLGCHKGGERLHWQGSPHDSRGAACTSCHNVMRNVSDDNLLAKANVVDTCAQCHILKRSQTFRNAHMPLRQGPLTEGWMDCTSCHNPHGTITPKLIDAHSINDACYSCHADKRGPFLWEHAPVTEDCTNCHDPHGSITGKMLKMPVPQLCQTCHVASRHPSNPYSATDRRAFGRGCLHCHNSIHGSNHPSGTAFTR